MNLIEAKGISHSFDNVLYKDVYFNVEESNSIAILGVSGSGKSTFINNLSTMLRPISGIVNINGNEDIYSKKYDYILEIRRKTIGIIFQSHYLFRGFSAIENLEVSSILSGYSIDMNLLSTFGIDGILNQQIGELSGGQQQRLSIARVLTKKPRIIFADEPTGNLDRNNSINVMNAIFKYVKHNRAAMVIATHDMEIAEMCDNKYYLKNQTLIEI